MLGAASKSLLKSAIAWLQLFWEVISEDWCCYQPDCVLVSPCRITVARTGRETAYEGDSRAKHSKLRNMSRYHLFVKQTLVDLGTVTDQYKVTSVEARLQSLSCLCKSRKRSTSQRVWVCEKTPLQIFKRTHSLQRSVSTAVEGTAN